MIPLAYGRPRHLIDPSSRGVMSILLDSKVSRIWVTPYAQGSVSHLLCTSATSLRSQAPIPLGQAQISSEPLNICIWVGLDKIQIVGTYRPLIRPNHILNRSSFSIHPQETPRSIESLQMPPVISIRVALAMVNASDQRPYKFLLTAYWTSSCSRCTVISHAPAWERSSSPSNYAKCYPMIILSDPTLAQTDPYHLTILDSSNMPPPQ